MLIRNLRLFSALFVFALAPALTCFAADLNAGKAVKQKFNSNAKLWEGKILKLDTAWFESEEARIIADSVLQYQSSHGAWPKRTDLARPPLSKKDIPQDGDEYANTIDNGATTTPMAFLAKVIHANKKHKKYLAAFNRGFDYLIKSQYPSGGWPQFWPLRGDKYYSRVTFNDEAMILVMRLLNEVAEGKLPYDFVSDEQGQVAAKAVNKGIDFILAAQVKQNGVRSVWCAQHHEETFKPAWARAYEPPSLSGQESVEIVRFLMSIEKPSKEVVNAIESAVAWFTRVSVEGQRLEKITRSDGRKERVVTEDPDAPPLWARFYELVTNRPLFLDRDSVYHYRYEEVGYERRSGYSYHGYWPATLLEKEYPVWQKKYGTSRLPKAS